MPRILLTPNEKGDLIEATHWINEMSFNQVRRLSVFFYAYKVPADTVLFREGDKDPFLVLIIKGTVRVLKDDSARNPKCIARLGPGRTIGEMSVIDGSPRSATAVTEGEAVLLALSAENFNRLMNEWPRIGTLLVLKLARLISQYLRQASGRLVEWIETTERS